nr:MAG TPA: hypothetical protein [Caudoviricetes sp.]
MLYQHLIMMIVMAYMDKGNGVVLLLIITLY